MPKHRCHIYALLSAKSRVFYVGRTNNVRRRMSEHKQVLGFAPQFKIIARCSKNCRAVERRWIAHYRNRGFKLKNRAYGGGPHYLSEDARRRMATARRGRKQPPGFAAKISAAQKARWARMSTKERAAVRANIKRGVAKFPKYKRREIGRRHALLGWAKWSTEDRAIINAKISATMKARGEIQRRICIKASAARYGRVCA